MRALQMEVSGQEILTKDKAALRINFQLQYRISDIEKALIETKDMTKQLYLLMQMAVREYIGTLTLDELLAKGVIGPILPHEQPRCVTPLLLVPG